jgi:hypothetical protein
MFTIKGFTTKKDVGEQLKSVGAKIKMPFKVNTELSYTKDIGNLDIYDCDGNELVRKIELKSDLVNNIKIAKNIIAVKK